MTAQTQGAQAPSMAQIQGATPPAWRGRSGWPLLIDVLGGVRQNWDKLAQLVSLLTSYFRPGLVRRRLEQLRKLGHIDVLPTIPQLLVAGRDQMMIGAAEETKIFYRTQGIPWVFHNLRRFLSGPATMLDPIGFFAPRDAIIHHVLQTFHRHPVYDLVLLRAHEGGIDEMRRQAAQILDDAHPHGRALRSLIEDGSYHARLPRDIAAFQADPHIAPRPIPAGLVADARLMIAMDQFKDVRGFTRYASRLNVGLKDAISAWVRAAFDETLGALLGRKLCPAQVRLEACDREIVAAHGL